MIARDEKKWRTTREKLEAAIAGGTTYGIRCRTALALLEEQEKNAEAAIARVRAVRPSALSAPGWEAMAVRVIRALGAPRPGPRRAAARFEPPPV